MTRPTADLGEDGELVRRLRGTVENWAGADIRHLLNPDGPEAADRLILYREALEAYVAAHDAWIEKDAGINAAIHAADAVVKASNNARAVLSRSGG